MPFALFCAVHSEFRDEANARMLGDGADAGGTSFSTNNELPNFQNVQAKPEQILKEDEDLQRLSRHLTRQAIKEGVKEAARRLATEEEKTGELKFN